MCDGQQHLPAPSPLHDAHPKSDPIKAPSSTPGHLCNCSRTPISGLQAGPEQAMASAAAKSGHAAEASHRQRGFTANSSRIYSKIKPRKVVVYEKRLLTDARKERRSLQGWGKA